MRAASTREIASWASLVAPFNHDFRSMIQDEPRQLCETGKVPIPAHRLGNGGIIVIRRDSNSVPYNGRRVRAWFKDFELISRHLRRLLALSMGRERQRMRRRRFR
jgi:hypothetical protein